MCIHVLYINMVWNVYLFTYIYLQRIQTLYKKVGIIKVHAKCSIPGDWMEKIVHQVERRCINDKMDFRYYYTVKVSHWK